MTKTDVAQLRLHTQGITSQRFETPAEVVRWHGAVQAQDYLASLWAIGLRTQRATEKDIENAITNKSIVRTWPMRGTIHFVAPEDARWLLEHLTPWVIKRSAGRYRQLGLDETVFSKSRKILAKALQGGKVLTRTKLYEILEAASIPTATNRGLHILGHLSQQGLLCFGPREGKQPTFVLLEEWLAPTKPLVRDEAVAELTKRYFTSHGPATLQDFAWWSGLTITEAKVGLESVQSNLFQEKVEDQLYWFAQHTKVNKSSAYLLPWFDEFLVAYKDRSAALEPSLTRRVNAGGGLLNPTVVSNGQVVGIWKRSLKKDKVIVNVTPFHPLETTEKHSLAVAAERYGTFLAKSLSWT